MESALLGLDPLFLTNVKLIIGDLIKLEEVNEDSIGVYRLFDHKIKLVEICGIIVAVERTRFTTNYTVDDSTGTITCSLWNSAEFNYKPLKIGTSVRVTGKITAFRDERQIIVQDIYPTLDPNQELQHIIQAILLRKEYQKSHKLPASIEPHAQELAEQIQADEQEQMDLNTQKNNINRSTFEKAVLNFLKNYPLSYFTKNAARDDPELVDMAKEILAKELDCTPTESEISNLFTKTVGKWLNQGYIIETGHDQMYKAVDEKDLAKLIVKSIKEMSKQISNKYSGIRIEYIMKAIAADKQYSTLETKDQLIGKIVDQLVEQSVIYPTGEKEYKVFM